MHLMANRLEVANIVEAFGGLSFLELARHTFDLYYLLMENKFLLTTLLSMFKIVFNLS